MIDSVAAAAAGRVFSAVLTLLYLGHYWMNARGVRYILVHIDTYLLQLIDSLTQMTGLDKYFARIN